MWTGEVLQHCKGLAVKCSATSIVCCDITVSYLCADTRQTTLHSTDVYVW